MNLCSISWCRELLGDYCVKYEEKCPISMSDNFDFSLSD